MRSKSLVGLHRMFSIHLDEEGARRAPAGVRLIVAPGCEDIVAPLVYAVPIQMLAYYVAVQKGADVDQPRNLAKSVTVE